MKRRWIDCSYNLLSFLIARRRFWYMCSVKKGTIGLIKTLTLSKTSNRTLRLTYMFKSSTSPFNLNLLSLTYQLVKFSRNLMSWGTTLYSLYSPIYFLTFLMRSCKADWIQVSVTLKLATKFYMFSTKTKFLLTLVSHLEIFWIKNLYALYQGKKIYLTTAYIPFLEQWRLSALTSGELIK